MVKLLTRLFVLGLLIQSPMSGYQIQLMLQVSQTEQWAGILPGSVYHALKKLEKEGLVLLHGTEMTGNRLKSIYEITPAGKEEFSKLLKEAWSEPVLHFPSKLYGALSFPGESDPDEILPLLSHQLEVLSSELELWNSGEEAKEKFIGSELPESIKLVFENGRRHIQLDMDFLKKLQKVLPRELNGKKGKTDEN